MTKRKASTPISSTGPATKPRQAVAINGDQRSGRIVGRPFAKGKSGNPSGRPKIVETIRDLARAHGERFIR